MSAPPTHGLDMLTDDELWKLFHVFRKLKRACDLQGLRAACACENEVSHRLSERGLLNLTTGEAVKP